MEEKKEETPVVEEKDLPPIMDLHSIEEENTALVVEAIPQRVETEQEKQQGRANSRVKDVKFTDCCNVV